MSTTLPVTVDLTAYRGDTWSQSFRFLRGTEPVDLIGCIVEAEARNDENEAISLLVTIEPEPGLVTIRLPAGMDADGYEYDVEVDDSGVVTTWVRGFLNVRADVTNALV